MVRGQNNNKEFARSFPYATIMVQKNKVTDIDGK